jgi:hypothetical protein
MSKALDRLVWDRAELCCEYCHMPQDCDEFGFEIDHVVATIHGGQTIAGNLCLSCLFCNRHKGPNLSGIDPRTRRLTRLFNPRRHVWRVHFRWASSRLIGLTAIGRTTIRVLAINDPLRAKLRGVLINEGCFPPRIAAERR